jgi:hypothetical protein
MAVQSNVYDELAEFLASLAPEKVLAFKPSEKKQQQLNELLEQQQIRNLTALERVEMEHLFVLERIIRVAKAHALTLLHYGPVHS